MAITARHNFSCESKDKRSLLLALKAYFKAFGNQV
jgi:hypothetical protein